MPRYQDSAYVIGKSGAVSSRANRRAEVIKKILSDQVIARSAVTEPEHTASTAPPAAPEHTPAPTTPATAPETPAATPAPAPTTP